MKFRRGLFLILLIIGIISSPVSNSGSLNALKDQSAVQSDITNDYWPKGAWRSSTPEEQGMNSEYLCKMMSYITENQKDIHSLLILRNGYLVTEAYFYPYPKDFKHILHSCAKSITSALIGIAINEGRIKNVNEKVLPYFPDTKVERIDDRKNALSIRDLLTMSTGLDWVEDGAYGSDGDTYTQMWKSDSQIKFILDRPMKGQPGKEFYYCSGASHLLSGILQKTTGESSFEYGKEKLFGPVGIQDLFWMPDRNGLSVGGSGLFMTPADMAKFGYLYLKKGKWDGRQVVPEQWIDDSTQLQIDTPRGLGGHYGYGYQWWMNSFGGYSARGYAGQYIFVIPRYEMVVVFTSGLSGYDFFLPEYLADVFILPAVQSSTALKPDANHTYKLSNILKTLSQAPQPKPIPKLPAMAGKISGKTFIMEDSSSLSLRFVNGKECWLSKTTGGIKYEIPVGLDDVFRITGLGKFGPLPNDNMGAFKGKWMDEKTFMITFRWLGDTDELKFYCSFEADKVKTNVYSKMNGYMVNEGKGVMQK
jgi:CubicO group peptidase (beta-lactamase class C family)